jgi:hypothetical protein
MDQRDSRVIRLLYCQDLATNLLDVEPGAVEDLQNDGPVNDVIGGKDLLLTTNSQKVDVREVPEL